MQVAVLPSSFFVHHEVIDPQPLSIFMKFASFHPSSAALLKSLLSDILGVHNKISTIIKFIVTEQYKDTLVLES